MFIESYLAFFKQIMLNEHTRILSYIEPIQNLLTEKYCQLLLVFKIKRINFFFKVDII